MKNGPDGSASGFDAEFGFFRVTMLINKLTKYSEAVAALFGFTAIWVENAKARFKVERRSWLIHEDSI